MEGDVGAAGPPPPAPRTDAKKGRHDMNTTILAIQGMHCGGCAHTIEALLARLPGVRQAEASFGQRQARILHEQNGPTEAELVRGIATWGFEPQAEAQGWPRAPWASV